MSQYEVDQYGFPILPETAEFLPEPEPVKEAPPVEYGKRPRVYEPILRPMMETPGQWYKIKVGKLSTLRAVASNLKYGRIPVPEGEWEFRATRDPDSDSRIKGALYVKYIGPQPLVPVEAPPAVESQEHPLDGVADEY